MKDIIIRTKYLFNIIVLSAFLVVGGFAYLIVFPLHLLWMMIGFGGDFRDSYRPTLLTLIVTAFLSSAMDISPDIAFLPSFNLIFEYITTGTSNLANILSASDIGLVKVPVFGLNLFGDITHLLFAGVGRSNVFALITIIVFLINTFASSQGLFFNPVIEPVQEAFEWIPNNFKKIHTEKEMKLIGRVPESKFSTFFFLMLTVVALLFIKVFITLA